MEELLGVETDLGVVEDHIVSNFSDVFSYQCNPCLISI
jgi:hypothetical protein